MGKFCRAAMMLVFFTIGATNTRASENPDELYRQGRFAEAEKAYARSDMDNPKDFRYRYNRGCAAYQDSDFQAASAAFSSVLRRSQDPQMKFRAVFNLGNIAFKQNDFESAVKLFRQAVIYDPENQDARYNLELALRKAEKAKQQQSDHQKKENSHKDRNPKEGQGDQGKDSDSQPKEQKPGEQKKQPQQKQKGDEARGKGDNQKEEQKSPQDLSGDLKPMQPVQEQQPVQKKQQAKVGDILDRKKAEALLDNLKEDRSQFLRFQVPRDKKGGVGSGKDW